MENRVAASAEYPRIRDLFERLAPLAEPGRSAALADSCADAPELSADLRNLLWLHERAAVLMDEMDVDAGPAASEWEKLTVLARAVRRAPSSRLRMIMGAPPPFSGNTSILQSLERLDGILEAPSEDGPTDPLVGARVGTYRIVEHIGSGGMGEVYRAVDTRLGRSVALKFLPSYLKRDRAARARFQQEAQAASALDHPSIGYIHEISEADDGRLYIAMAYYEGETLDARIARGALDVDEALDIARQIADGLARAHEAGIIHRDIKPANVVVTPAGCAKILDFGLAKVADVTITRHGQRLGTAAYMSPEQARGEDVDERTDVWSLGVVLYEMLTGARPFNGAYEASVVYALLNEEPRALRRLRPEIDPAVESIVDRCIRKGRDERYVDMRALRDDLDRVTQTRNSADTAAPRMTTRAAALRRSGLIGAGGLGLLTMILLFGIWMRGSVPDQRHLAVLPFDVIGDAEYAHALSAGIVQTVTSKLTQLEQFDAPLWVVPASEIQPGMTALEARERFGATIVVSGSVQVEEDRIRLILNLIDAQTRRQIGSEQIDYERTSALALQDEAALLLAAMLRVRLQPEAREMLIAGGTRDPEANMLYLRGWGYLREQDGGQGLDRAISFFEEAVASDTLFALAFAGLGEAFWRKYKLTEDVRWVDEAVRNSRRALQINDDLAPVHVALGVIQAGMGRVDEAQASFGRALAIDPHSAEAYRQLADAYSKEDRVVEAERAFRRAIELKPEYWRGYNSLGAFYVNRGRYDEAVAAYERGLQLAPANQTLLLNTASAYWDMMRFDEAARMLERFGEENPEFPWLKSNLATLHFYAGRFAEAARYYEEELAARPNDFSVQGYLGDAYYWMGDRDRAREAHRKAIDLTRSHLHVRGDDPDVAGSMAGQFARLGETDSARTYLSRVTSGTSPADAPVSIAFGIGEIYESIGDRAEALKWMLPALENDYGWMQLLHSPWLRELRRDPVVAKLIEESQLDNE